MSRQSTQASWPTGWVARHLGISPITLRTWETRYGIGPSVREEGRHRRYTTQDIERLRLMRRLIAEGSKPREAARLALVRTLPTDDLVADADTTELIASLHEAAERLHLDTLADLLDTYIESRGVVTTWCDVLRPVITAIGDRSVHDENCRDVEWALAGAIAAALDRSMRTNQVHVDSGHAALLVCCPEERHTLPLRVLAAALHERSVPTVFLGEMVPADTALAAERRLRPAVVVLWALRQENAAHTLARRLHGPVLLAGSGWDSDTPTRTTDDLDHALHLIETLVTESSRP